MASRTVDANQKLQGAVALTQLLRTGPVAEVAARAETALRDEGAKGRRARLAQETLQILEAGGYRSKGGGGSWVDVQGAIAVAVAKSSFHSAGPWQFPGVFPPVVTGQSSIEVRKCYVLDAAESLARCGSGARLGVLNFASARNPGGGFTTGAEAQEESIARSSALYPCLMKHFDDFFIPHRKARSGAYTHALIHSPGVPVIRNSTGALLDVPYHADFVTAAAPNLGTMTGKDPAKDAEQALHERVHRVLGTFACGGATDLVLGAWGCGVFKNDPRTVASVFADHLGREFHNCFRNVVFAVPDEVNGSVFEVFLGSSAQAKAVAIAGQVSVFSQTEKDFLKFAKSLRDILKIEKQVASGNRVEATQIKKIDKKDMYLIELRRLEQRLGSQSDVRAKCKDIVDFLLSDESVPLGQEYFSKEGKEAAVDDEDEERLASATCDSADRHWVSHDPGAAMVADAADIDEKLGRRRRKWSHR